MKARIFEILEAVAIIGVLLLCCVGSIAGLILGGEHRPYFLIPLGLCAFTIAVLFSPTSRDV